MPVRYAPDMEGYPDTGFWPTMSSDKDGDYVLFEVYARLAERLEKLEAAAASVLCIIDSEEPNPSVSLRPVLRRFRKLLAAPEVES